MTDQARPYTDDDLRAEAARQHAALTDDPDFMGVGEAMEDRYVESTVTDPDAERERTGSTWGELLPYNHDDGNAYNAAQREIHRLISRAADVSEWAVNLGADGLEPDGHTFQLGAKGPNDDDPEQPFVRLYFAFHPDATDAERDRFVLRLTQIIAANV